MGMQKRNMGLDFTLSPQTDHVIPRIHSPKIGLIHWHTAHTAQNAITWYGAYLKKYKINK